jgi:hypothetical protein
VVKGSNVPTVVKRARIILHSFRGFTPPKIAELALWSGDWVCRGTEDHS